MNKNQHMGLSYSVFFALVLATIFYGRSVGNDSNMNDEDLPRHLPVISECAFHANDTSLRTLDVRRGILGPMVEDAHDQILDGNDDDQVIVNNTVVYTNGDVDITDDPAKTEWKASLWQSPDGEAIVINLEHDGLLLQGVIPDQKSRRLNPWDKLVILNQKLNKSQKLDSTDLVKKINEFLENFDV